MDQREEYVARCNFCILGARHKRGVLKFIEDEAPPGVVDERIIYRCGLGDLGRDCVIPKIYSLLKFKERNLD